MTDDSPNPTPSGRDARVPVAVLISGRGSNLEALIDAARDADYPARIVLVVSNKADAAGLNHAQAAGIATRVIPHRDFPNREAFDAALDAVLREAGVQYVCLAGFMRLLTPGFVAAWQDRILNIHPALLPAFRGLDTHARALAAGVRFSGCTAHLVRAEMDDGPIIAQAVVPVLPDDDAERLAARVLAAEHRCLPMALALLAAGHVVVDGQRAHVHAKPAIDAGLFNPRLDSDKFG